MRTITMLLALGLSLSWVVASVAGMPVDNQGVYDEDGERIVDFPNVAGLPVDNQGVYDEDGERIIDFPTTNFETSSPGLLNASRPVLPPQHARKTLGPRRPRPVPGWGA